MKVLIGFPRASWAATEQHMWHCGCFTGLPQEQCVYLSPHEGCIWQILPWVDDLSPQIWLGKFGSFIPGFYGRLGDVWHQLFGLTGQSGLCFNPGSTPPLTPSKPLPSWEQTTFKIKTQTLRKAKNPLVIFPVWRGEAVTWIMIN